MLCKSSSICGPSKLDNELQLRTIAWTDHCSSRFCCNGRVYISLTIAKINGDGTFFQAEVVKWVFFRDTKRIIRDWINILTVICENPMKFVDRNDYFAPILSSRWNFRAFEDKYFFSNPHVTAHVHPFRIFLQIRRDVCWTNLSLARIVFRAFNETRSATVCLNQIPKYLEIFRPREGNRSAAKCKFVRALPRLPPSLPPPHSTPR